MNSGEILQEKFGVLRSRVLIKDKFLLDQMENETERNGFIEVIDEYNHLAFVKKQRGLHILAMEEFIVLQNRVIKEYFFRNSIYLIERINNSRNTIKKQWHDYKSMVIHEQKIQMLTIHTLNLMFACMDPSKIKKPKLLMDILVQTCKIAFERRQMDQVSLLLICFHHLERMSLDSGKILRESWG